MHFIISMSKRVVRRVPSLGRSPASMVMACAGQIASHSLQAMQRSSPFGLIEAASVSAILSDNLYKFRTCGGHQRLYQQTCLARMIAYHALNFEGGAMRPHPWDYAL